VRTGPALRIWQRLAAFVGADLVDELGADDAVDLVDLGAFLGVGAEELVEVVRRPAGLVARQHPRPCALDTAERRQ
jgi:prepilin signal peptidase PulO-like enzyme (type II secretory pathway)